MATVIEQPLVDQLARRMAARMGLGAAARTVALRALRPHPLWIAAGAIWAVYEIATAEGELDVGRMQSNIRDDVWATDDMTVFRRIFRQAETAFLATALGRDTVSRGYKYILIPSQIMPMIAQVDYSGMAIYGQQLIYDRPGRLRRRRAALGGRGPAGMMSLSNGVRVPGSWEEYPFAVTYSQLRRGGSHVGRVPLTENWSQGGLIAAAKFAQRIVDGDQVFAHVI